MEVQIKVNGESYDRFLYIGLTTVYWSVNAVNLCLRSTNLVLKCFDDLLYHLCRSSCCCFSLVVSYIVFWQVLMQMLAWEFW